jgi:hypothetical protein
MHACRGAAGCSAASGRSRYPVKPNAPISNRSRTSIRSCSFEITAPWTNWPRLERRLLTLWADLNQGEGQSVNLDPIILMQATAAIRLSAFGYPVTS